MRINLQIWTSTNLPVAAEYGCMLASTSAETNQSITTPVCYHLPISMDHVLRERQLVDVDNPTGLTNRHSRQNAFSNLTVIPVPS